MKGAFHHDSKKKYIKSVVLNSIIMIVLFLLFEPVSKSDDYDQVMILTGAYTGEYSSITLYTTVFFSRLCKTMYTYFPSIAWYYVIQYILIFFSLTEIGNVILKKNDSLPTRAILTLTLLFCGYESYIRFTFTKTAGIAVISGFICLLDLILEKDKRIWQYAKAILIILCGVCIRGGIQNLIILIFSSTFIIYLIQHILEKNISFFQISTFIGAVIIVYGACCTIDNANKNIKADDERWEIYGEYNSARARLQDYSMASFGENTEQYQAIGMSVNDYITWKEQAIYCDYDYYTKELLGEVANFSPVRNEKNIIQFFELAVHNSLSYYMKETGFYVFFFICLMFLLKKGRQAHLYIGIVSGVCFSAYTYMLYLGRLQHHVDVCVMIAGTVILLYYYSRKKIEEQCAMKKVALIGCIVFVQFIVVNYGALSSSSYYGTAFGEVESQKEKFEKNKKYMDELSKDKEHFYVFSAMDGNYLYENIWGMFEMVEPMYYSNLAICNRYHIPDNDIAKERYGIQNIFKEASNSDVIRFATTIYNKEYIDVVTTYIQEHYNANAHFVLEKEIGVIKVYYITDKSEDVSIWL